MKKIIFTIMLLVFGLMTFAQDYGVCYTIAATTSIVQFNIGKNNDIYVTSTKGKYHCLKDVKAGTLMSTAIADLTTLYPIGATVAATASITTLGVTGTATIGNIIAGASTFGSTLAVTGKQTMAAVAPLAFTSTAMTKGLDFDGVKPAGNSSDNALIRMGGWSRPLFIDAITAHTVGMQVNLKLRATGAYDAACLRLRLDNDADSASTDVNGTVLQIRSAIKGNIGSITGISSSLSIDNATTFGAIGTAGGYFNIQGAGAITSATSAPDVILATSTHTGGGMVNVGHFTTNASTSGVTNIMHLENIAGTSTNALKITATGGTLTNDINLQNGETISNGIDGTVAISGAVQGTSFNFCPASGVGGTAASAVALDYTPNLPTLAAGTTVMFIAEGANTTTLTIAIDGGTAKNVYEQEPGVAPNALDGAEIQTGTMVLAVYDGTQFVLLSPIGNH